MKTYVVSYGMRSGRGGVFVSGQDVIEARDIDEATDRAYARKGREDVLYVYEMVIAK